MFSGLPSRCVLSPSIGLWPRVSLPTAPEPPSDWHTCVLLSHQLNPGSTRHPQHVMHLPTMRLWSGFYCICNANFPGHEFIKSGAPSKDAVFVVYVGYQGRTEMRRPYPAGEFRFMSPAVPAPVLLKSLTE